MDSSEFDFAQAMPVEPGHGDDIQERLRRTMVTGAAVTLPLLVTLVILGFVLNFLSNLLNPFVGIVQSVGIATNVQDVVAEAIALAALVALVFVVGVVAENRDDDRLGNAIEALIEGIPGIGAVYTSFNRMSEVLVENDSQSFQEVKLVEFPYDDTYTLGFVTANAPEAIEDAAGESEMQTLFVPMAPNPVMGGFLVSVPVDRVLDVDLSVEEGVQAIVTSGVAVGDLSPTALDSDALADLTVDRPEAPGPMVGTSTERARAYDRTAGAEHASTPDDVNSDD